MGTKETLVDLREFETGLSMYRARLKACWTREWHITQEEEALINTDRARLQRAYGALRAAIAQANGGVVPHFGYGNMDLGEIGHVALGDPDNDSSVMDALDMARQMVAQAIGYFEHVEREESRKPAATATPLAPPPSASPSQSAGHRSPSPRGWAEACIALGALIVTYALQPYVYPPPDHWRTPLAVAGAIVSLIGVVLLLVGRASSRDGAARQHVAVGGDGHGARQASNVTGSGNTVTQAARDVIGVQNVHHVAPLQKTTDESARQRDIAFAHRLNEKYEDGVHRILNYPFHSEQAVFKFKDLADAWTEDVVKDLRAHPCTPHEITRFRVLQEVPRDKHFHPDPAWDDLKQQFNERLNRLRVLIERYEKPPAQPMPKYRVLSKSEIADLFEKYVFKFITNDIEREVQLAWRTVKGKREDDLLPGGGNVLTAMGRLAATEFLGQIWMHAEAANRKWGEEERFDQVLRRMGDGYAALLDTKATTGINVYSAFRSGLLHFYGVGGPPISADMPGTNAECGVVHENDGWHFVVEVY